MLVTRCWSDTIVTWRNYPFRTRPARLHHEALLGLLSLLASYPRARNRARPGESWRTSGRFSSRPIQRRPEVSVERLSGQGAGALLLRERLPPLPGQYSAAQRGVEGLQGQAGEVHRHWRQRPVER